MAETERLASRMKAVAVTAVHVCVYIGLGQLSFATAYLQANTATIWIPSGYAIGLLIVEGPSRWPAVALGSFALNLIVNAGSGRVPFFVCVAVAAAVALGNTGEALLGSCLAGRFAGGAGFFRHPRGVVLFASIVAPIAPLLSMGSGVLASWLGGLVASGSLGEVMLTWYVANAIGILVFTAPFVVAWTTRSFAKPLGAFGGLFEALALTLALIFVSEAICGVYLADVLHGWPRTYMIFPLLVWAAFRFGTPGAILAVLLVTALSVVGTIAGFAAFPAETASRSLIYLQLFLGVSSSLSLLISAGLWENWELLTTLEEKVRDRTAEIDRHLREKEAFTVLVVHDLQSPLYGVRNALRAAVEAIGGNRVDAPDLVPALAVMEGTCSALAERVAGLLAPARAASAEGDRPVGLMALLRRIADAHRLSMDGKDAKLRLVGDGGLSIRSPDKVEHILDALIDNALKVSPAGASVEIVAEMLDGRIHIRVTDHGRGVPPEVAKALFLPRPATDDLGPPSAGLGLSLAHRQAIGLGGELSCIAATPRGSTFRLVFPA